MMEFFNKALDIQILNKNCEQHDPLRATKTPQTPKQGKNRQKVIREKKVGTSVGPMLIRVFLNLGFGEPMFRTLGSRGFRHFRAFRDFRKIQQSTHLLVAV